MEIVAHHVDADPDCADFGTFARRNPALLDKRLLSRHYRSSTLAAAAARRGWVEPDLVPFPWAAQGSSQADQSTHLGHHRPASRRPGRRRRMATSADAAIVAMRRPTGIFLVPGVSAAGDLDTRHLRCRRLSGWPLSGWPLSGWQLSG